MASRIFSRCLTRSLWKPAIPLTKLVSRSESVLPAYCDFVDNKDQVNLQSVYSKFPNAEGFVNLCKKYNLNEQSLAKVIETVPEVTNFEPSKVSHNIEQFLELDFSPAAITTIIETYPRILDYETNEIVETFETWRSGNLSENFLRRLFTEYSWLLSVDNEQVKYRLHRISYLMVHKINRVFSVLLTSPTIMLGNWDEVEDKFMYCLKEMRYLEKEISRSTALARSISHIKLRHMFVERAGVYIRPGMKDLPGMNTHKNPSLAAIVDPDDDQFALNTAQVSPEEYMVFLKLMHYYEDDSEMNKVENVKRKRIPDNEFEE